MIPARVQLAVSAAGRTATASRDLVSVTRALVLPARVTNSADDRVLAVVDATDDLVAQVHVTFQTAFQRLPVFRAMSDGDKDRYLEGVLRSVANRPESTHPIPIAVAVWTDGELLVGTVGGSHIYICPPTGETQVIGSETDDPDNFRVVRVPVSPDTYLVLVGPVVARSLMLRDIRRAAQILPSAVTVATWLSTLAATIGSHDSTVLAIRLDRVPDNPHHEEKAHEPPARSRSWTFSTAFFALLLCLVGVAWLLTSRSNQSRAAVSVIAVTPTIATMPHTGSPANRAVARYVFRMAEIILSVQEAQRRLSSAAASVKNKRPNVQARRSIRLAWLGLRRSSGQLRATREPPEFALLHRDAQRVLTLMIHACLQMDRGLTAIDRGRNADARRQVTLAARNVSQASQLIHRLSRTA